MVIDIISIRDGMHYIIAINFDDAVTVHLLPKCLYLYKAVRLSTFLGVVTKSDHYSISSSNSFNP